MIGLDVLLDRDLFLAGLATLVAVVETVASANDHGTHCDVVVVVVVWKRAQHAKEGLLTKLSSAKSKKVMHSFAMLCKRRVGGGSSMRPVLGVHLRVLRRALHSLRANDCNKRIIQVLLTIFIIIRAWVKQHLFFDVEKTS